MNFIIPLVVYPFDIMFSVGETDKQLKKKLKSCLHKDAFKVAYSDDFLYGFNPKGDAGQALFIPGHRQTIIRLGKHPSVGTTAHEIFHACEMILRYLKMPLSTGNDEAYAYLIQYVTDQFYKEFQKL